VAVSSEEDRRERRIDVRLLTRRLATRRIGGDDAAANGSEATS